MQKLIILSLSICFGLSGSIGNAALPSHDLVINSKTTIEQEEAIDTHNYNNLHIKEAGQLHIANTKQIKNAKTIFQVTKDIIINGKITCDDNVHVQLISENICFDTATVNARSFTCLAESISIKESNISTSNLHLGSFAATKTLCFDAKSTIIAYSLNSTINLLAKNTLAFGSITAPVGTVEVSGSKSIKIDGIKVDTKYKHQCGTFIIDPVDVVIAPEDEDVVIEDSFQEESYLISNRNIKTMLETTNVEVKASESITVNAPITNNSLNLLTLNAPLIIFYQPVIGGNLALTNTETTEKGTVVLSSVSSGAGAAAASLNFVHSLFINNCTMTLEEDLYISPKEGTFVEFSIKDSDLNLNSHTLTLLNTIFEQTGSANIHSGILKLDGSNIGFTTDFEYTSATALDVELINGASITGFSSKFSSVTVDSAHPAYGEFKSFTIINVSDIKQSEDRCYQLLGNIAARTINIQNSYLKNAAFKNTDTTFIDLIAITGGEVLTRTDNPITANALIIENVTKLGAFIVTKFNVVGDTEILDKCTFSTAEIALNTKISIASTLTITGANHFDDKIFIKTPGNTAAKVILKAHNNLSAFDIDLFELHDAVFDAQMAVFCIRRLTLNNANIINGENLNVNILSLSSDSSETQVIPNLKFKNIVYLKKGHFQCDAPIYMPDLSIHIHTDASLLQKDSVNIHSLYVKTGASYMCFNNSSLILKSLNIYPGSSFIRLVKETDAATGVSKYAIKEAKGLKYLDTITNTEILSNLCFGKDMILDDLPDLTMQRDTTIDGQGFKLTINDADKHLFKKVLPGINVRLNNLLIESSSTSLVGTVEGTFSSSDITFKGRCAEQQAPDSDFPFNAIKVETSIESTSSYPENIVIGPDYMGDRDLAYLDIEQRLTKGDVAIKADKTITINEAITNNSANLLTLDAPTIIINAPIVKGKLALINTKTRLKGNIIFLDEGAGAAAAGQFDGPLIRVQDLSIYNCTFTLEKVSTNSLSLSSDSLETQVIPSLKLKNILCHLYLNQGHFQLDAAIDMPDLSIHIHTNASLFQKDSLNIHSLHVKAGASYMCFNNSNLILKSLNIYPGSSFIRLVKETDAATGVSKYAIKDSLGLKYLDTITNTAILSNLCFGKDMILDDLPNLTMQRDTTIDGQGFKLTINEADRHLFRKILPGINVTLTNLVVESSPTSLIYAIEAGGTFNGSHLAFRGGNALYSIVQSSHGTCNLNYVFATEKNSVGLVESSPKLLITNSYFIDANCEIHAFKADGSMHRVIGPFHLASSLQSIMCPFNATNYQFADFAHHATTLDSKSVPLLHFEKDMLGVNIDNVILGDRMVEIDFCFEDGTSYQLHNEQAINKLETICGNIAVIRVNYNYVIFAGNAGTHLPFNAKVLTTKGKTIYHVDVHSHLPNLNSPYTINMHDAIREIPACMFDTPEALVKPDSEGRLISEFSIYVHNS